MYVILGVDLYECCFPCGPWSPLGSGLGLKDKDGDLCFQAVNSIKYMQPVFYFMENVVSLGEGEAERDLSAIVKFLGDEVPGHHHLLLQGLDPSRQGYPAHKPRLCLVGCRKDQTNGEKMVQAYQTLADSPVPVVHSFRSFLGMKAAAPYPWDRVGGLPTADEGVLIAERGCTCSLDPMVCHYITLSLYNLLYITILQCAVQRTRLPVQQLRADRPGLLVAREGTNPPGGNLWR